MNELKISFLQTDLYWEDRRKNLSAIGEKINQITEAVDVIVLPEMFSSAFTMNSEAVADTMNGECVNWMRQYAKSKNAAIAGSLAIKENENYFNRFIWMNPDGTSSYYDKRHLFRMADEHMHFKAGSTKMIVQIKQWKVLLQVCYDLRFPVWSRRKDNQIGEDYDLIIYVANWPERRRTAWNILLQARAIENQCYVLGVNRVGKDGKEISYAGDSALIDFLGNKISKTNEYEENAEILALNLESLKQFRNSFPAASDADKFEIK